MTVRGGTPARDPTATSPVRLALTAMLRWRLRQRSPETPARTVNAARLIPVLLHTSFDRTRFRGDAPGVEAFRYRRSWRALANEFGLPAPSRMQRGAPLVEAVLAVPRGERVDVLVLTAPGLAHAEFQAVADRAVLAQDLLGGQGVEAYLRVTDAARISRDPDLHRVFAFGALVGGRPSTVTWAALEATAVFPLEAPRLADLAAAAPDPLSALALALLSEGAAPPPMAAAALLARRGVPASRLADPAELCARWAAEAGRHPEEVLRALAVVRPGPEPVAATAGEVVSLGRTLAVAAARALRRSGGRRAPARLWEDVVGPGLPRALLPPLGERLGSDGPLRTVLARAGRLHEVRLPDGTVLGRGATPVQARVRALALLASAALDPVLAHAEQPWRSVAARLAQRRTRPTLLLAVEPAAPSGPPFDPLNRGPTRAVGFPGALALRIAPGHPPAARVVGGAEAVDRVVREAALGRAVEILPARSEAHPVAARLAGLAARVREAPPDLPLALEAGGRVITVHRGELRHFPIERFAGRPRAFHADPDAPDLALSPGERRPVGLSGPSVIECRAALLDDLRAVLVYADSSGGHLREEVLLAHLEDHLRDGRELLQGADPDAILAVRLSDDVEPALRRVARGTTALTIGVGGAVPLGLELDLGGTRFGGRSGRRWPDAARAALSFWPRDGAARIRVSAVTATLRRRRVSGLLTLWVRSYAIRRMRALLLRELRTYQLEETRRRA